MRSISDGLTELEVKRYRESLREEPLMPEPESPPLCLKHNWRPVLRGPQPRPRLSECPGCKAEADHRDRKPRPEGYARVELSAPEDVKRTPAMDRAYERHLEKQAASGVIVAGSQEEERVIAELDAERKLVLEADHPQRRVAFERIEDGRIVQYFHPQRKRRPGRVGMRGLHATFPSGGDDGRPLPIVEA